MRLIDSTAIALLMLGTAASAADMARPIPYVPPPVVIAPSWTGFYLGLNVGGAFGEDRTGFGVAGTPLFASIDNPFGGVVGGGQLGYNWQFGSFVAGVETDIQATSMKSSLTAPCPAVICVPAGLSASYSQSVPWFGTVRGRIGYAQDTWLVYATGGYAYAGIETDARATAGAAVASFATDTITSGFTVGAGIEVGVTRNWSVRGEYLYVDLDATRATWTLAGGLPSIINDSSITMNVVRAGVNYRF